MVICNHFKFLIRDALIGVVAFIVAIAQIAANAQSLDLILVQHETNLAKVGSFVDAMEMTSLVGEVEQWRVSAAPGVEVSELKTPDGFVNRTVWDGESLNWTAPFDPIKLNEDPRYVAHVRGYTTNQDHRLIRPYRWWSMEEYRPVAIANGIDLRALCESSLQPVRVSNQGSMIVLDIVYPGYASADGRRLYTNAAVKATIDPEHGYLVQQYETISRSKNVQDSASVTVKAKEFQYLDDFDAYRPSKVEIQFSGDSRVMTIEHSYNELDANVEEIRRIFVENMLVREYPRVGSNDVTGYYVVDENGALGEKYQSERIASQIRLNRLENSIREPKTNYGKLIGFLGLVIGVSVVAFWRLRKR